MYNTVVFIDMGHSSKTPGKRSPDSSFFEWEFNRRLGRRIIAELQSRGIDARPTTTPEEDDTEINLTTRCRRADSVPGSILVSIHSNAAGDGRSWSAARGWEVHVAPKCSWNTIKLADSIYDAVAAEGFRMRPSSPNQKYRQSRFTVLTKSRCPAVLTESLFYDNKEDLALLKDPVVFEKLVRAHVNGITKFVEGA